MFGRNVTTNRMGKKMNSDYADLKQVQQMRGYAKLQALWAHEYGEVMKSLQRAAAKNNESNWRHQAGILKGFDLAIGQLDRALIQMEKEGEADSPATKSVEELLSELKGEKQ